MPLQKLKVQFRKLSVGAGQETWGVLRTGSGTHQIAQV